MSCTEDMLLTRRRMMTGGAASLALWGLLPKAALAGTRDPRLLTIVLRGGLDGLSMLAPVGDPNYAKLRQQIAMQASGERGGLALDGFFALNPNMPYLHQLYGQRQALFAHAIHTPYRGRSHFDGQDVLEGGVASGRADDGWLNRALIGLSSAGKASPKGLAMDAVVPLVMRGKADVLSWIPKVYDVALQDTTVARLLDLYAHTDPVLAKALGQGMDIARVAAVGATASVPGAMSSPPPPTPAAPPQRTFKEFTEAAEAAATFLSAPDGPRIGALSYNGWDTHANEGVVKGQLGNRLAGLDLALKTFHDRMGDAWKDTVVIVVTEFGRTARVNGTEGTDHGMATVALLIGGAVNGGRLLADWPGLADGALYEQRDLKPTADLRGLLKGVLRDHLGVPDGALSNAVFPSSAAVTPMQGLIRT